MASNLSITDSTPEITRSERITWVLIWYLGILPALWLSPVFFSWLKHKARSPGETSAPTAMVPSSEGARLEAAEQSRNRLQARVNGALWQAGWMIVHVSLLPVYADVIVRIGASPAMEIDQVVGSYAYHASPAHWGITLFGLSINPTESKRIRSVLRTIGFFFFALLLNFDPVLQLITSS